MPYKDTSGKKVYSTALPQIIAALVLLFVANILMATVLLKNAHHNLQLQLGKRMLDVSNTAADLLDADFVGNMQVSDINSAEYDTAMHTLRIFQENINLSYIYLVRPRGDGTFMFLIDPDPNDPAPYGYDVVVSEALLSAAGGAAAVDDEAYTDRWGKFYTAYTPVLNADGKICGIVGVDYDANLYKEHVFKDALLIIIVTMVSMVLGMGLAIIIVRRNRQRYEVFNKELTALNDDFRKLGESMKQSSAVQIQERPHSEQNDLLRTLASDALYQGVGEYTPTGEFTDVSGRLSKMQEALRQYVSYLNTQTYVDPMTLVNNKIAYQHAVAEINKDITEGKAKFAIGFFDVNELKSINTQYGFEVGDTLLYATATMLKDVFQQENVYRVASDEFIVIMKGKNLTDMDEYFIKFCDEIYKFNDLKKVPAELAVSKGSAVYNKEDKDYRSVFIRAEENQRRDKAAYYNAQKS